MKKVPWQDRLRYVFDNTLSRGPIALIGWLGLASAILVIVATLIVWASTAMDLPVLLWNILFQAMTPNPVDPTNQPLPYLAAMLVVTFGSLFMVSILIGVLTTSIEDRVGSLRKGRSKVIEDGHVIILGWDEHIFTIISELVIANENQPKSCIVIMGQKDKVEMEDEIREKIGHTGRTRIVCRSGSPIDLTDLEIVSLNTARAIIVLPPADSEGSDASVIKTLLAITNNPRRRPEPYHIVAEIYDPKNVEVARLVGREEVELVLIRDVISRVIAQTCRQSGLSVVYTELLNFEGDEIYFKEEPSLVGKTFGETLAAYEDSTVIGLCPKGSQPRLNPPMDTRLQAGDELIAISEDDDTVRLSGLKDVKVNESAIVSRPAAPNAPEHTLILGWNKRALAVIRELDNYVAPGSAVTVVADTPEGEAEVARLQPALKHQSAAYQVGDTTSRHTLDSLGLPAYKHIVVLSYSDMLDNQEADARTLITLLHLRDIGERAGHTFSIVSEMLDDRNRALAEVTHADDFIVSDMLASLLLSQIAENKALNAVFTDIFDPEGSEIYLKPAPDYVKPGEPVNFYTVVEAARRRGQVAIGYRLKARSNDAAEAYGVVVNPDKSKQVTFAETDRIIVVAED